MGTVRLAYMGNIINRSLVRAGVLAMGAALLLSCRSIKEDRELCPAFLNVSFADRDAIVRPVTLLGYGDEELFRESIDVSLYDPYWVKAVRKGVFNVCAYYGRQVSAASGLRLTVPLGSECDSLYAFHTLVDCTGEEAYAEVKLHKQFCTVHLDIRKPLTGDNAISNYSFLVEGNTCGFDLLDFRPVSGSYRIEPSAREGETIVDFRIPRQVDDSMKLSIWYNHPEVGVPAHFGTFPLGEYFSKMGYDWKADDLQDFYVAIDVIAGLIVINVEGWEEGYTFQFIEQ